MLTVSAESQIMLCFLSITSDSYKMRKRERDLSERELLRSCARECRKISIYLIENIEFLLLLHNKLNIYFNYLKNNGFDYKLYKKIILFLLDQIPTH